MREKLTLSQLLTKMISSEGIDIIKEPRIMGWVQDLLGGSFPLAPVLRCAIKAEIPQQLMCLSNYNTEEREVYIDNITMAFQDYYMLRPQAAAFIVYSFAYALGYVQNEPEEFSLHDNNDKEGNLGEPVFIQEDDGEYCGYHKNYVRSGFGILRKKDGGTYFGDWRLGARMGLGVGADGQSRRYAGQWYLNRKNGVGMEMNENGVRFTGIWKQGKQEGWNLEIMPNGESRCRLYDKGQVLSHKIGACLMPNGDIIVGKMGANGPEGKCIRFTDLLKTKEETWENGRIIIN